jgi:thiamine kinase-like enzyme
MEKDTLILHGISPSPLSQISETSMSGEGGLSSTLTRIKTIDPDGITIRNYVHKTTTKSRLSASISLGLAREALFYSTMSKQIEAIMGEGSLPHVFGSIGSMTTGEKSILLESVDDSIQAGYLFGSGSPHNWNRNLDIYTSRAEIDLVSLSELAFKKMARLHRAFWNDSSLFSKSSWLRGAAWKEGKEKESWEASQAYAASSWSETMNKIKNNIDVTNSAVKWDPLVIDIVNASLASASWTENLRLQSGQPFTLVHGDLHPANCLWVPSSRRLVFLDFENVGIGSGPQDCAQFLISHMNPLVRAECEKNLMKSYYEELTQGVNLGYSWEQCWSDYISGGAERWIWLLCILSTMCPDNMVQYFHDQTASFIKDHNITPKTIGMPRV